MVTLKQKSSPTNAHNLGELLSAHITTQTRVGPLGLTLIQGLGGMQRGKAIRFLSKSQVSFDTYGKAETKGKTPFRCLVPRLARR
jgi:hypothetical protein